MLKGIEQKRTHARVWTVQSNIDLIIIFKFKSIKGNREKI